MQAFSFTDGQLVLGKKTYIMGILNYTPDSFSDGGKWFTAADAVGHAVEMEQDGADIIDIGAFSTRPGADYISPAEEWERLSSVLPDIIKNVRIPVSVDTFIPETAEKCLECGVSIINDVSGSFNEKTAEAVKRYNAGWILMHGGVSLGKAESITEYPNGIIPSVQEYFDFVSEKAAGYGISSDRICLDPGFGFSKDENQNLHLLKNLKRLSTHGSALMSALSRKRFVGAISNEANAQNRDEATLACNLISVINGADIIRVHNVKLHARAFKAADMLLR